MSWTDERVRLLRNLWLDGRSCSQIAAALACGLTRNAVIGKAHRLGLAGRARSGPPKSTKSLRAPRPPRPPIQARRQFNGLKPSVLEAPKPIAVAIPFECIRVTLEDLNLCMCKWPLDDARYCGLPTPPRVSYCAFHKALGSYPIKDHGRIDQRRGVS